MLIVAGCARKNQRQLAFEKAKEAGDFQLIASSPIKGDKIKIWKRRDKSKNTCFGDFLISAESESGEFIDFQKGKFTSSTKPFYKKSRYFVMTASGGSGKDRYVFFIYDSQVKKFSTFSVDEHVHENIFVNGNELFFSSCKTPKPLGKLIINSGNLVMFGAPAPQGASLYLSETDVFVKGNDGCFYKIEGINLIKKSQPFSPTLIHPMPFDSILIKKPTKGLTSYEEKKH